MALTDMPARPERWADTTAWHLRGNNAPVIEEVSLDDLAVQGALPPELAGRFLRNGPNPQTGNSAHWFMGDGMVHGLRIENGEAKWYRNRYVRTPVFANPNSDRTELSLDPETFEFDLTVSAANTHVISHAGRILALEEGGFPYEISPDLDTIGPVDFDGKLTTAMTAHPKTCPETGELMFFGYDLIKPPFLTYHRADANGTLLQSVPVDMGGPTMVHDFAVSRKHIVVMDLPMVFDIDVAMQGGMPIAWSDDYPARMGVMPRTGGEMKWFDVDPCYVFHTLNAHDVGDDVVVMRGCRIRRMWVGTSEMDSGSADDNARLHEWSFNLRTGKVTERQLDDTISEFPRMADAEVGLDSRYGWVQSPSSEERGGKIFKYDLHNDERQVYDFGPGVSPAEPVHVAAEEATNADDGWIMTFTYDRSTDTSSFVVLDASQPSADPAATVPLPVRVPSGFHGSWVPDA